MKDTRFKLLSSLEKSAQKPAIKEQQIEQYQIFEAQLGFEKAVISIPLKYADDFETAANLEKPQNLPSLKKLVEKHNGKL